MVRRGEGEGKRMNKFFGAPKKIRICFQGRTAEKNISEKIITERYYKKKGTMTTERYYEKVEKNSMENIIRYDIEI